ncbi:hypothetical protein [Kordia sp.]|nr:hypothetical protein [Kordia sp.]
MKKKNTYKYPLDLKYSNYEYYKGKNLLINAWQNPYYHTEFDNG